MTVEICKDEQTHVVEVLPHPVLGHVAYLDDNQEPFMITDDELFTLLSKGQIKNV